MGKRGRSWCFIALTGLASAACTHGSKVAVSPPSPPSPPVTAAPDPVAQLIAEADAHLAAGMASVKDGHLERAREEFDRAIDVYIGAPGGAAGDTRLFEAYRRTVEAIHLKEMETLTQGDGFTEVAAEPAARDELGELPVDEQTATEETVSRTVEAVQEETLDFPVELNDAVLTCVDLYQGRLRDWFEAALNRGQRHLPYIREIFASEGLPRDLAYLAMVESAFKPNAYSRAKAKGVWQFVSATGKRYGLQQDWWVDERSDTEKATRAAAAYLKELYAMFGDWNLAMAAYNAGEGKIQRGIVRYKTSDYWQLRKTKALKRETRNYVPLIHAAIVVAKAPDKYGFTVEPPEKVAVENVPIEGAIDLRVIAECVDTPVEDIQSLNPVLRRLATPASRTFDLRVPHGKGGALLDCIASLPPEKRVRFRTYVVGRGQTLASIARANGVKAKDIADANNLSPNRRLKPGTDLIIPVPPTAPTGRRAAREAAPAAPPRATQPSAPAVAGDTQGRVRYRIKPGDTLTGIAAEYGVTVSDLRSWNKLRGSVIAAGSTLTIYTDTAKN
jgi:membrane-bound lytic murein transglycosylase D